MAESIILNLINNVLSIAETVSTTRPNGLVSLLSFLLVFAISFASIGYVPAFKDDANTNKKALRTIISLAIAFFTATNPAAVNSMEQIFPSMGVIIIGSSAFLFTIYFVFSRDTADKITKIILGPLVLIAILLIIMGVTAQVKTPIITITDEGFLFFNTALLSHVDVGFFGLFIIFVIVIFFNKKTNKGDTLFDVLTDKIR